MKKLFFIFCLLIGYQGISQKVGINNTDPQTALDVNGKFRIRATGFAVASGVNTLPNSSTSYYSLNGNPGADFSIVLPAGIKGTFLVIENTTNYVATVTGVCKIFAYGESKLFLYGDTGWKLANNSDSPLEKINEGYTGWRLKGSDPNNYGNIGGSAIDLSHSFYPSSTHGATGIRSFATGHHTTASGESSSTFGYGTTASGYASSALGFGTTASGLASSALGYGATATGNYSIAANDSWASGLKSAAFNISQAHGENSFSTGNGYVHGSGKYAAGIAGGGAFGKNTSAFGEGTHAISYSSTALGRYNISDFSYDSLNWVATEPILSIGNGTSDVSRSNAMTIYKNGNTDISGYTRLGTTTDNAPRIKMKKMVIPIGPPIDNYQSIAFGSGITDTKILGVEVLLNYSNTYKIPPGYLNTNGYQYDIQLQGPYLVILLKPGNSFNIGDKPITVLVTYEE